MAISGPMAIGAWGRPSRLSMAGGGESEACLKIVPIRAGEEGAMRHPGTQKGRMPENADGQGRGHVLRAAAPCDRGVVCGTGPGKCPAGAIGFGRKPREAGNKVD